jgi:signal transduction histidine kinase
LHDAVGQTLTGLRMELAALASSPPADRTALEQRLAESKQLAEETLRLVRDLAMGLRPSMLDDLGLGPALEYLARDVSRRSSTPVHAQIDGRLDSISDMQRISIYRIVQEALTNCVRHAKARSIRVTVHGDDQSIRLTVQDDGIGFDRAERGTGLGLLGIGERVRELGGNLKITSGPGRGTLLEVKIPTDGSHA